MAKESLRDLLEFYRDHVHQVKRDWYLASSRWSDKLGSAALSEIRMRAEKDVHDMHPEFTKKSDLLWSMIPSLDELKEGAPRDIENALNFCEIDVLAFQTGYVKASIYQVLKRLDFTKAQKVRICRLGLLYVEWPGQRREMRELARLLIVMADENFVLELSKISENSLDKDKSRKANIILYKILNSRMDLRMVVPLPKSLRRY